MSSTCWSFASTALLESELLKKGKKDIDLSEMFIARYSYLRKIHRHLLLKGRNFFTPGGQFHDVSWVIKNHGIVPESAYPGRPNGALVHDHARLDTLVAHYIKDLVASGITVMSSEQEKYITELLDQYLGVVPSTFYYEGTLYTPRSFVDRVLEFNPDDYVEITSYTHHPFYTPFVLEDKYNWTGDAYHNVPLEDFSRITDTALALGYTVGWDGDADDPFFQFYKGIAWLPSGNDQAYRQQAFEDQSTLLTHMMQVVGKSKDKYGRSWYYIKNSWGDYSNSLGGFLFMRDDYFRMRTVAIIVNKNAIPSDLRAKMRI
jgi:Aminopeptidase C